MKTGLYFGSYNPIHIGHLIVANSLLEVTDLDEIWMVVSPANPLKDISELADEGDRLKMVELAIADNPCLKACDIEFSMPRPSYTIHTLEKLEKDYPDHEFTIIMGSDNLVELDKWKDVDDILKKCMIHVYNRRTAADVPAKWLKHERIRHHELPLIDVSSTMLRMKVRDGKSIRYWVTDEVDLYVGENGIYSQE